MNEKGFILNFYFRIYDSNNVQVSSQRYYGSDTGYSYKKYTVSTSLNPGIYTMKLYLNLGFLLLRTM